MESWQLKQLLSLSPRAQLERTKRKIKEAYQHWEGQVYVALSGGRDSSVLLHVVRSLYPGVPAVFCDTGLEYPSVRKTAVHTPNVTILKPKLNFREVLTKYGYPVVSKEVAHKIYQARTTKSAKLRHKRLYGTGNKYKSGKIPEKWKCLLDCPFQVSHKCCDIMKKNPSKSFEKRTGLFPIIGTMVKDSHFRRQSYMRHTCNAFDLTRPRSAPLSLWSDECISLYVKEHKIKLAEVYSMGEDHTGCMFCAFGVHREKEPNKFQRMKKAHPNQWKYCMDKLGVRKVLDYIGVPCE